MFAFMWGGWVDKNTKKYILPDNLDRIFIHKIINVIYIMTYKSKP